tara:strand:+ start:290 stop:538 length:249 start_codon:yes stop_codon:yes gene_type:complete
LRIEAETYSVTTLPELVKIKLLLESSAKKLDVVVEAKERLLIITVLPLFMEREPVIAKVPETDSVSVGVAVPIPTLPPEDDI